MRKDSFEILDDGFLNFYEEWIFVRCFEFSALEIWELFWYKIMPWISRKTWKIFLEVWFPKVKKSEILSFLDTKNYNYRFTNKNDWLTQTIWTHKILKDFEKLLKIKKELIKFE